MASGAGQMRNAKVRRKTMSDYAMTKKVVDVVNRFRGEWPEGYAVINGVDRKAFNICTYEMFAATWMQPEANPYFEDLVPETDIERALVNALLTKLRS